MAQPAGKVLEGVFATYLLAISKPPSISSAQVLRDLQHKFAESKTFAPLLEKTRKAQEEQERHQPKRRKRGNDQIFKMGHGGTLDPLATGVLIVGLGRGSKSLPDFLGCKKTYETVVLFGKSTDTYDIMGKIVAEAPTETISQQVVEDRLTRFRGKMKQIPPIYSAIKIDGMKLYEYARSGKELPRELESREVEISECTLLDFYGPGEHDFRWPAEEASEEEKAVAQKLMAGAEATRKTVEQEPAPTTSKSPSDERYKEQRKSNQLPHDKKAELHTHHLPTQEAQPANAPAARIRLTVSSGFYVRSFAYDLGIACGSYGTMAALVRSKQGDYTSVHPTPEGFVPALTYYDLEAGEDVWGPKIADMLEKWMETHPAPSNENRPGNRDRSERDHGHKRFDGRQGNNRHKRAWGGQRRWEGQERSKRRNSSSPE
ncbi:tRNA pseudouridine(55) synthase [Fonsecaea monophora]|uniref:tRNA pseudouridine(55) synthase n=1 Tax=Fonsecaea monophora TaxID=254056 RepID=A0A177FP72_9EURO|nr:tRNA pseudouridine(55) synthase [Fonsecaea monophora]OAG44969.1 tRNA pseudouridine(55) synthase [Fonsecaea monophora]